MKNKKDGCIPIHGQYKKLISYQKSHSPEEELRLVFVNFFKTRPAEICANIAICLINQCSYLLKHQINQLEDSFVEKGGLRENMYKARVNYRK